MLKQKKNMNNYLKLKMINCRNNIVKLSQFKGSLSKWQIESKLKESICKQHMRLQEKKKEMREKNGDKN